MKAVLVVTPLMSNLAMRNAACRTNHAQVTESTPIAMPYRFWKQSLSVLHCPCTLLIMFSASPVLPDEYLGATSGIVSLPFCCLCKQM
jgi:hypothetical protein